MDDVNEPIEILKQQNAILKKTIESLVGSPSLIRRLDCHLISTVRSRVNNLNYKQVLDFINNDHESLLIYILFENHNPIIKFKQTYIYLNEYGSYCDISFLDLSNLLFTLVDTSLKSFMKKCIRLNPNNETVIENFETNIRLFNKNKDNNLKKILNQYT